MRKKANRFSWSKQANDVEITNTGPIAHFVSCVPS